MNGETLDVFSSKQAKFINLQQVKDTRMQGVLLEYELGGRGKYVSDTIQLGGGWSKV